MPLIRVNRPSVDDRFSVLGFTVRTESPLFEVGIGTDPTLFRSANRSRRNRRNFYSSRSIGAIHAPRGEAVYLVPPDVLANFVGQPKLYFGLATYRENSGGVPDSVQAPSEGHMYVDLSGLTERGLRRLAGRPSGNGAYGAANGHDPSLDWGGDAQPQAHEAQGGNGKPAAGAPALAPTPAPNVPYDDGFGKFPTPKPASAPAASNGSAAAKGNGAAAPARKGTSAPAAPQALARSAHALEDEDADAIYDIDGPIPDDDVSAQAQNLRSRAMDAPAPEYPGASRFAPAHPSNYRAVKAARAIDEVVIHITDGGSRITGTIGWFQNPDQRNALNQAIHVSAHYVVGRDGEVVQMVRNNDVAWHAGPANGHSIGIEHVANTRGLTPTEDEYRGSAALVAWLCQQFSLPIDRTHILGHAEADPHTTHTDCPNAVWDWGHYMDCVREAAAAAAPTPSAQSLGRRNGQSPARSAVSKRPTASAKALAAATFTWPAGMAAGNDLVQAFIEAYNARAANSLFGIPGHDPSNFAGADNSPDAALRRETLSNYVARIAGRLGSDSGRLDVSEAILQLTTAVSMQVLDVLRDHLPKTLYQLILAGDAPPTQIADVALPRDLTYLSRRIGMFMAWVDVAIQQASSDTAARLAAQKDEWDSLTSAVDTGSTLIGLIPGAGEVMAVIGTGLHLLMQAHAATFDREYASFDAAMHEIRRAYTALPAPVLRGLIANALGQQDILDSNMLHPDVRAYLDAHSAYALQGWEDELAFLSYSEGGARAQAAEANARVQPTARARPFTHTTTMGRVQTRAKASSRAQALTDVPPVDLKLRVFIPALVVVVTAPGVGGVVPGSSAHAGDGRGFQLNGGTSRVEIAGQFHFGDDGDRPSLTDITRSIGKSFNYDTDDTVAVAGKPEWYRALRPGAQPIERGGQSVTDEKARVALGGSSNDGIVSMAENAVVVTFDVHASNPIVTGSPDIDATLAVLLKVDGDRVKARVRGGHDEFPAYELYANGTRIYAYDPVASGGTPWGLIGDGTWDVNPEGEYVDVGPASDVRIIGPVHIGGAAAQSLSLQSFSLHWDDTPYQPQSTDSSCWAASAAMVVGWRDRVCIPDAEIAAHVPVIDAYRQGLPPSARQVLGDAWNLVAEPPASYAIDGFRQMLADYGPLYVGMNWSKQGGGHARVLVGMESGGAEDGSDTTMFLYDPWPDTPGRIRMPFNEFVQLYEGRMTGRGGVVDVQILHADSAQGRSPATAAPFALSLTASQVKAPGERNAALRPPPRQMRPPQSRARSLGTKTIEYPVQLVPQPDKNSCWAASMAMLLSFRRNSSYEPETLAGEVGGSLMSSYGWDLLQAVRDRYGFTVIEVPSNTSLYFSAAQWAQWLREYGPLWVVIVGMPHAVVVSGLRGDTDDANACEVKLLNPWDTRVTFDDDAVTFHPANAGYVDWLPFQQFASDFGNMAEADYGNWRVLYLPAQPSASATAPAAAQAFARSGATHRKTRARDGYLAAPPKRVRAQSLEDGPADEPIEPSRVAGTTMRRVRGSLNRVTWALDQLDGVKVPDPQAAMVPALVPTTITLDQWPRVGSDAVPLPVTVRFDAGGGAVGNVRISAGTAAQTPYDVTVTATIEDDAQTLPGTQAPQASLRVTIDYDFAGTANGDASARIKLRLVGNGRYDLDNTWQ